MAKWSAAAIASLAVFVLTFAPAAAQVLTGTVTSTAEGPMEGVLVSAQRTGSPITVTVVSDEHGRFSFPPAKIPAGHYALRIRAIGYELDGPRAIDVGTTPVNATVT